MTNDLLWMDEFDYEKHSRDFLDYVALNEKRLKRNLRKNVTYDSEIFDDVFNDSIVKTYDHIINKRQRIEDFEQFFFIVSKFRYIQIDNKKKKEEKEKSMIPTSSINLVDEEYVDRSEEINSFFLWLSNYLEGMFPSSEVDLFVLYYRLKVGRSKVSYQKLARITNRSYSYVAKTIKRMKEYVNSDEEIMRRKKELY